MNSTNNNILGKKIMFTQYVHNAHHHGIMYYLMHDVAYIFVTAWYTVHIDSCRDYFYIELAIAASQ